MINSRRTVATVAVICCLFVAGCTGSTTFLGDSEAEVDVDALEANAESAESYHVEITRTLQSVWVNETVTVAGTIDADERRAHLTTTSDVGAGAGAETREDEEYVLEGVHYTEGSDGWEETNADWEDVDHLGTALNSLENATFETIRTETVNGVETTVFEVNVSEERRNELAGIGGPQHVSSSVEEFVYYVLVDTDTDTLYGTDMRMVVNQGGDPAYVTVERTFSDYDEPVDISPPAEIAD